MTATADRATDPGVLTSDPVAAGASLLRRTGSVFSSVWPPVVLGVVVVGLWQWVVTAFHVSSFVLPAPSAIYNALRDNSDRIIAAAKNTGSNALVGLLIGSVLAVIAAALVARFRVADDMITP